MPKVRYKGQVYDMPWNDSTRSPSMDEIKTYLKSQVHDNDGTDIPPVPRFDNLSEFKPGAIPDPRSIKTQDEGGFVSGLTDTPRRIFEQVDDAGRNSYQNLKKGNVVGAFQDVFRPVIDPFTQLNGMAAQPSSVPKMSRSTAATQGMDMLGLPGSDVQDAINQRDYPRLAGQAVGAAALIGGTHAISRMGRGTTSIPSPVETRPVTIPPPEPVNRGIRLPAITETTNMEPTRFYQGRAGTVDARNMPPVDMGPNPDNLSGTVLPQEFGQTVIPPPTHVAENGPSIGRPIDYQSLIDQRQGAITDMDWRTAWDKLHNVEVPNPDEVDTAPKDRTPPATRQPTPGEARMAELRDKFGGKKTEPEPARDTIQSNMNQDLPPVPEEVRPYERSTPYEQVTRQVEERAQTKALREKIKADDIPTDPDTVAPAMESPVPEIKKAAAQTVQQATTKKGIVGRILEKTGISGVARDLGMGSLEAVKRMGPEGQEIWRKVSKARLDAEALAGDRTVKVKQAVEKFADDPGKFEQFRRALDYGEPVFDPEIQKAIDLVKAVDNETVQRAKTAGVSLRTSGGKRIPFQGRENYWPHIYPREFFANKEGALKALIDAGLSPEDAKQTLKNSYQWGERLISAQHGRQADVEGYRTDLNALLQHVHDMARRTVEAEEFGPMDLADKASPLGSLVGKTSDPVFTNNVLSRYLGRDEPSSPAWARFTKTALKAEAFMHLSQFAISNLNNAATIPIRANSVEFGKALFKAMTKEGKWDAERSGALQTIHQEALREAGGEGLLSRAYLMHKSEGFNRAVASIAGMGTAKDLFVRLKEGKGSADDKARLGDLLLEDVDKVLKQGELSNPQIQRAGGRMAEITQGRAQSIDLPHFWSEHPATDLVFLFKKYAFRQSKIIKDALTTGSPAQRARNAAVAAGLLQLTGEVTGDAKAAIRGAVSGAGAAQQIQDRGQEYDKMTGGNEIVDRVVANYMQAWALGLVGDAIQAAASGEDKTLEFLAGPVVQDIADVVGNVTNPDALSKKAVRSVPVVGGGASDRLFPKRRSNQNRLPSLPRMTQLPRLPKP
jgi:hypothetical protein